MEGICIFWFRRDLRLEDNVGLYHALKSGKKVIGLFVFDEKILSLLPKNDRRVAFIHQQINRLNSELKNYGSSLICLHTSVLNAFTEMTQKYPISDVYCNHDYEPAAIARDAEVDCFLKTKNMGFKTYKDQVVFEKNDIVKADGLPYTVYTPYAKKWRNSLIEKDLKAFPSESLLQHFYPLENPLPTLKNLGFEPINSDFPSKNIDFESLKDYGLTRDFPIKNSGSRLGIHFRFGTISVRNAVKQALKTNDTWLSELIWREFFMQIIYHFPHVEKRSFRPSYDRIEWRNNEDEFQKWCKGQTGYPIVDAGMRELNATGNMHNRVRMVVASFLCKHLLIDWRWGELYFAEKLNDYDLSANNGNWQWSAGCGCDAAPYFRVFNPTIQTEKFDKNLLYIRKWVADLNEFSYPKPMVEHSFARERAIACYKKALIF